MAYKSYRIDVLIRFLFIRLLIKNYEVHSCRNLQTETWVFLLLCLVLLCFIIAMLCFIGVKIIVFVLLSMLLFLGCLLSLNLIQGLLNLY